MLQQSIPPHPAHVNQRSIGQRRRRARERQEREHLLQAQQLEPAGQQITGSSCQHPPAAPQVPRQANQPVIRSNFSPLWCQLPP